MKRLLLVSLIGILLISTFSVGLTFATQPPRPYEIIMDTIGTVHTNDVHVCYDTASATMLFNIYDTLIFFDEESIDEFVPWLAEDYWISKDEMTYTFKIREGVVAVAYNPDGTIRTYPLDETDVEYSFERGMILDPAGGPMWMLLEPLTGYFTIRRLDLSNDTLAEEIGHLIDNSVESFRNETGGYVVLHLAMHYPPIAFLQILSQTWSSILCKEWAVEKGCWPGWEVTGYVNWRDYHNPEVTPIESLTTYPGPCDAACGSGPYMLYYWNKGYEYRQDRNPYFWGGWGPESLSGRPGWIETWYYHILEEWADRLIRFTAGDSDLTYVPRENMHELLDERGVPLEGIRCIKDLLTHVEGNVFFTFYINPESTFGTFFDNGTLGENGIPYDFFTDVHVRKAFAYCFDFETYCEDYWFGEAIQPPTCLPAGYPYFDTSLKPYPFDLTKAEEEFKAAWGGQLWTTGFTVTITYNSGNTAREKIAMMLKTNIESLNDKFHVTVTPVDWATYIDSMVSHKLPVFIIGWLADYAHPHNWFYPYMHSWGDFAYSQNYISADPHIGKNPNVDAYIEEAFQTTNETRREELYKELQRLYLEEVPSFVAYQPIGRRWEREWVHGWFYNSLYPGTYMYWLWKQEYLQGDVNWDNVVDMKDIGAICKAFMTYPGHPRWNWRCDITRPGDRIVDMKDIGAACKNFMKTSQPWVPPS